MKEWLLENLNWLVPCAVSLFGGTSLCSIITLLRTATLSKALKNARESKYWSTCPHCKRKVYFDELSWRMPDGVLDNNLNGVDDSKE